MNIEWALAEWADRDKRRHVRILLNIVRGIWCVVFGVGVVLAASWVIGTLAQAFYTALGQMGD